MTTNQVQQAYDAALANFNERASACRLAVSKYLARTISVDELMSAKRSKQAARTELDHAEYFLHNS